MSDLESIKIILRSLLVSNQDKITVDMLRRDYRQMEEKEIPFRALGYRDFESFLRSIPDTVRVYPNGFVSAVTNSETAHIAKMVALQRPKPKRRRPPRLGSSYQYSSSRNQYSPSRNQYSQPPRMRQPSAHLYRPPHVQRSSVNGAQDNTTCSYNSYYNQAPTFNQSNYSNGLQQPQQISEPGWFSEVEDGRTPKKSVQEFISLAAKVLSAMDGGTSTPASVKVIPAEYDDDYESGISDGSYEFVTPTLKNEDYKDVYFSQDEKDSNDNPSYSKVPYDRDGIHQSNMFDDMGPAKVTFKERVPVLEMTQMSLSRVSDRMKKNFSLIINKYPDGIWCCELPDIYESEFGVPLNFNELGYTSVSQMVHDLPDVFVCRRIDSGDWKLFDPERCPPADNNRASPEVPHQVAVKIYRLASKYPSGVRSDQFCELYRAEHNISLLQEAPNFPDVETLLLTLQDSGIHLRYICKECFVYPSVRPPPPGNPLVSVPSESASDLNLYPEEVLAQTDTYLPSNFTDEVVCGSYIEILVAEVYTPHRFWIVLRGPNHHVQLEKLMEDLQEFYKEHGEKYCMPDATIAPGQCCVAKYSDDWHRARISSVINEREVEVLFIDYGTLSKVPKKGLRFIHRDFQELPTQGILASLFGIEPRDARRFTREANEFFLNLCLDKPLVAMVQNIDKEKSCLELFLIDTSGEDDVHLNDVLVEHGHATFSIVSNSNEEGEDSVTTADVKSAPSTGSTVSAPVSQPSADTSNPPLSAAPQIPVGSYSTCPPPPGFQGSSYSSRPNSQPAQSCGVQSGYGIYGGACNMNNAMNANLNSLFNASIGSGLNPGLANGLTGLNPLLNPTINPVLNAAFNPALASAAYSQITNAVAIQNYLYQLQLHQSIAAAALQGSQNKSLVNPFFGSPWPSLPVPYPPAKSVVSELPNHDTVHSSPTSSVQQVIANSGNGKSQNTTSDKCDTSSSQSKILDSPHEETDSSSSSLSTANGESDSSTQSKNSESVGTDTSDDDASSKEKSSVKKTRKGELTHANTSAPLHKTLAESTAVAPLKSSLSLESVDSDTPLVSIHTSVPPETSQTSIMNAECVTERSEAMSGVSIKTEGDVCESKTSVDLQHSKLSTSEGTSSDDVVFDSDVIDCWEEIADNSDTKMDSKSRIISLVSNPPGPSNASTSLPQVCLPSNTTDSNIQASPSQTRVNMWKTVEVDGKQLMLFNIDSQGFVSTNELAKECTSFSSSSILVRVLEHKNIHVPYMKLQRSQCLPVFASLDGCSKTDIDKLGLTLNKESNVMGTLHLTPLGSITYMLMVLGVTNMNLIRGFQKIRDTFDPHDGCWKNS